MSYLLVQASSNTRLRFSSYGLVFFGTPHNGGNKVALGKFVAAVVRKASGRGGKNPLLVSLEKEGYLPDELKEDFKQQLTDYAIVSFYEDRPTRFMFKDFGLVCLDDFPVSLRQELMYFSLHRSSTDRQPPWAYRRTVKMSCHLAVIIQRSANSRQKRVQAMS